MHLSSMFAIDRNIWKFVWKKIILKGVRHGFWLIIKRIDRTTMDYKPGVSKLFLKSQIYDSKFF